MVEGRTTFRERMIAIPKNHMTFDIVDLIKCCAFVIDPDYDQEGSETFVGGKRSFQASEQNFLKFA